MLLSPNRFTYIMYYHYYYYTFSWNRNSLVRLFHPRRIISYTRVSLFYQQNDDSIFCPFLRLPILQLYRSNCKVKVVPFYRTKKKLSRKSSSSCLRSFHYAIQPLFNAVPCTANAFSNQPLLYCARWCQERFSHHKFELCIAGATALYNRTRQRWLQRCPNWRRFQMDIHDALDWPTRSHLKYQLI